jgi:SAM-dependent methyltransferase
MRDARRYGIGSREVVLDLGSGQDPHPRANILCDKFVVDNTERACGAGLMVDRPLVLADATATPFPDKAFDFVFCSHLLEHMDNPAALLTELQRISKRGYIETPSLIYEKLWGWEFHRWFVSLEGERLVIEAKDGPVFDADLQGWFSTQIERPSVWRFFMPRLYEMGLLTVLVWDGAISYEVRGEVVVEADDFVRARSTIDIRAELHHAQAIEGSPAQRFKSRLSKIQRRGSDALAGKVLEELHCPIDHGRLYADLGGSQCALCGNIYPVIGTTHLLLPEYSERSSR